MGGRGLTLLAVHISLRCFFVIHLGRKMYCSSGRLANHALDSFNYCARHQHLRKRESLENAHEAHFKTVCAPLAPR